MTEGLKWAAVFVVLTLTAGVLLVAVGTLYGMSNLGLVFVDALNQTWSTWNMSPSSMRGHLLLSATIAMLPTLVWRVYIELPLE